LSEAWARETSLAVGVLETRRIADVIWLRVAIGVGEACEFLTGPPIAVGWVKAHNKDGQSIVWFDTFYD